MSSGFIIEGLVIALVLLFQLRVFKNNLRDIHKLKSFFPHKNKFGRSWTEDDQISLSTTNGENSEYDAMIDRVNDYIMANRRYSGDFALIRQIVEERIQSLKDSLEPNLSTPLYIGLLGTFAGIITGLLTLVILNISAEEIDKFMIGVSGGLLASASGLGLTIFTSGRYKRAKDENDIDLGEFLEYLRRDILPDLQENMSSNMASLQSNLAKFNDEFSVNIDQFKGTISLVTDNVDGQTKLLKTLSSAKIVKLAEANEVVFSKINENAEIFGRFTEYQQAVNHSAVNLVELFENISEVIDQVKEFRTGFNKLGEYIERNDSLIAGQVTYLNEYFEKVQSLEDRLGQEFTKSHKVLENYMAEKMEQLRTASNYSFNEIDKFFVGQSLKSKEYHDTILSKIERMFEAFHKGSVENELIAQLESMNSHLESIKKEYTSGFDGVAETLDTNQKTMTALYSIVANGQKQSESLVEFTDQLNQKFGAIINGFEKSRLIKIALWTLAALVVIGGLSVVTGIVSLLYNAL